MVYQFGDFRLDTGARRLLKGDDAVALTPKEFQTLLLLVEAQGRALERECMIQSIWPDTVVGDTSLGRNVSVLRRHLGSEAIEAVPRFGYRFGLAVTVCDGRPVQAAAEAQGRTTGDAGADSASQAEAVSAAGDTIRETSWKRTLRLFWQGSSTRPAAGRLMAVAVVVSALGLVALKGPARWAWANTAALKAGGKAAGKTGAGSVGTVRLAVLPFRNVSAKAADADSRDTDYLRDGIADELTARLGELSPKRLQVLARSTTGQYADTQKPTATIAAETGAQYLLEGSVKFEKNEARVTAYLVDAETQAVVWSQVLERPVSELSSMQEEIANRIAGHPAFAGTRETPRKTDAGSVLPEAYDEYLRGRFELSQTRRDSYQRALTHFERAVKLDPSYAKGYTGVAEAYIYMTDTLPLTFCYAKAHEAVLSALQFDETSSDAHRDLGWLQMYERNDPAGAEAEFRRALELNPDDARTHYWYASKLSDEQRYKEAVQQANIGYQLDPRSAHSAASYGIMLVQAGDIDRGKQMIDASLKLDPDYEAAWGYLGMVYLRMRKFQEAAAAYDHAASFESFNASYLADAAYARAKCGDATEARRLLKVLTQRMERRQWFPAQAMAMTEAALGNKAATAEWLRRAVQDHSVTIFELSHEPFSTEMKDQPGSASLLADAARVHSD
jgi:TolB-like protein/DNA-binding winged helix-turn-helix (wHTH) protein/tetratricopeptide (TPR) repeat protein